MKEKRIKGGHIQKKKEKTKGEWGWKKQKNKQNKGGLEKPKNKETKPKWWGRMKKTKRGIFTKWQLNSFILVKFVWPHWMMTDMDSVATKYDHHHWMANKMDLVVINRWQPKPFWLPLYLVTIVGWRPKRGEYDITPFCLFQSPIRMGDLKKYGCHLIVTIFQMEIEIFNCQKRGSCHMFFKTSQRKLDKNLWQPPFCGV